MHRKTRKKREKKEKKEKERKNDIVESAAAAAAKQLLVSAAAACKQAELLEVGPAGGKERDSGSNIINQLDKEKSRKKELGKINIRLYEDFESCLGQR